MNMTKEELKIKLYERMAQRIGDERFGLPAQQAAGRFTALQEQMGGHVGVYAVDSHSCVVDAAMAKLAEPENPNSASLRRRNKPLISSLR